MSVSPRVLLGSSSPCKGWLKGNGVTVLRFWNNDVLENLEGVWGEIARTAARLRLRPATPTLTLPLSGGGDLGEVDR